MNLLRRFIRSLTAKILLGVFGTAAFVYVLMFTPWGNRATQPLLEKALSSGLSTPIHVREFSLTHKHFHLIFQDSFGNTLSTQGGFSLLTLRLYAHYRLECLDEKGINFLESPFNTTGALSGGIASLIIQGDASLFEGKVTYKTELRRFHLSSLESKIDKIAYMPLMHFLDYPSDTKSYISGDIELKGLDRNAVFGNISLVSKTDTFTPTKIVKSDDNDSFELRTLFTDDSGEVSPFTLNVDLNADIEHAGILEQFVGISLSGPLKAKGNLSGDEKRLVLKTFSDIAQSDSKFTVTLDDFELSSLILDVKNSNIQECFKLFGLPAPIHGLFSAYAEFNATQGVAYVAISKATTQPKIMKQHYQITQTPLRFDATIDANITEKGVHYRGALRSNLVRLEIDKTTGHDQMLRELLKTLR